MCVHPPLTPHMTGASATQVTAGVFFNPLSPKSDQHQISPCNINASLKRLVMRITDMITQDECA